MFFSRVLKFFTGINLNYIFIGLMAILLAVIVLPNISAIAEKMGLETRSTLAAKAAVEKKNADIAIDANNNTVKANDILKKTADNKVNTISVVNDKVTTNNDKANTIITKRQTQTAKIKTQPKQPTASVDPKLKMAMQLSGESLERVKASEINALVMLEAYCEYNKDENCKPLTKII
jgi:hypothetical protein